MLLSSSSQSRILKANNSKAMKHNMSVEDRTCLIKSAQSAETLYPLTGHNSTFGNICLRLLLFSEERWIPYTILACISHQSLLFCYLLCDLALQSSFLSTNYNFSACWQFQEREEINRLRKQLDVESSVRIRFLHTSLNKSLFFNVILWFSRSKMPCSYTESCLFAFLNFSPP